MIISNWNKPFDLQDFNKHIQRFKNQVFLLYFLFEGGISNAISSFK